MVILILKSTCCWNKQWIFELGEHFLFFVQLVALGQQKQNPTSL